MTTRTQIIEGLKAAKRNHSHTCTRWHEKSLSGALQCSCGAARDNASIDAAIAELEKQPAEQVPVAHAFESDLGNLGNTGIAHMRSEPEVCNGEKTVPLYLRPSTAKEVPVDTWGPFRHNNGVICCGSLRVARADFDNNTTPEVQKEILDALCASRPPADVLAVLDELEKIAIRSCSSECTINFEYMSMPECTCGTRNRNAMLEDRFAKLRSLLGGEV